MHCLEEPIRQLSEDSCQNEYTSHLIGKNLHKNSDFNHSSCQPKDSHFGNAFLWEKLRIFYWLEHSRLGEGATSASALQYPPLPQETGCWRRRSHPKHSWQSRTPGHPNEKPTYISHLSSCLNVINVSTSRMKDDTAFLGSTPDNCPETVFAEVTEQKKTVNSFLLSRYTKYGPLYFFTVKKEP